MKRFFIFIFLIYLSITLISAFSFDQGKLYFTQEQNVKSCQVITLSGLSTDLSVRDVWAENPDEDRNLNYYTYDSSDHGISISYNEFVPKNDNDMQFEICISGNKIGEYKGLIIFSPESETNVVVEKGIWLFVTINEHIEKSSNKDNQQTTQTSSESSSSSSGGGGAGSSVTQSQNTTNLTLNGSDEGKVGLEILPSGSVEDNKDDDSKTTSSAITGSAIGNNLLGSSHWLLAIAFVVIIGGIFVFVYNKRRNNL